MCHCVNFCIFIITITFFFFLLTISSRMSFSNQIVMTNMNYTELYNNIVLATNNMFSLSKVTIYISEAIFKYIDFMISSSIPFTIIHKLLGLFIL